MTPTRLPMDVAKNDALTCSKAALKRGPLLSQLYRLGPSPCRHESLLHRLRRIMPTATTSLTLATQRPFGTLTCDFYKNDSNEFYMTREQIGTALEYANAGDSIRLIHK